MKCGVSGVLLTPALWWTAAAPVEASAAPLDAARSPISDVARWIRELGDPVYAKRVNATRRLCAQGPAATELLKDAASGEDFEVALRAQRILRMLDRVLFAGVKIRLEADQPKFAWNQAVGIRIVMENASSYPAKIPFNISSEESVPLSDDARQVADMMDGGEWLLVEGPQHREIDLRVDEIAGDAEIFAVVQGRLTDGPRSILAPGARAVVSLPLFNRGWARYPLLDAGDYWIRLQYVPPWSDPVLAEAKSGFVESNTLVLTVTQAAPETVSRNGTQPGLDVTLDQGDVVARLVNRSDQTILVNVNYGLAPPFAEIQWIFESGDRRTEVWAGQEPGRTWSSFDAALLRTLEAGSTLELARVPQSRLKRQLSDAGARLAGGDGSLSLRYVNACDRQWQAREHANLQLDAGVPAVLKSLLPPRLLSVRLTSHSIRPWKKE